MTFLVGSGSGSGSGKAFRFRLRVKLFGGSGSGSGSGQNVPAPAPAPAPAPMFKSSYEPYLTSNTIFKNVKYQNMTSYLPVVNSDLTLSLNATFNECLCNLSPIVIQGQWLTLERSQTPWGCAVRDKWITA